MQSCTKTGDFDNAFVGELLREPQVAGIERFDFNAYIKIGHHGTHRAQHARRVGHDVVRFGEVHRAAVQRADFGAALRDVFNAISGAGHVRAFFIQRQRCIGRAGHKITTHTGGEIDDNIRIGFANALGHFPVEIDTGVMPYRFPGHARGSEQSRRLLSQRRSRCPQFPSACEAHAVNAPVCFRSRLLDT